MRSESFPNTVRGDSQPIQRGVNEREETHSQYREGSTKERRLTANTERGQRKREARSFDRDRESEERLGH
jgi:hypothetical protein